MREILGRRLQRLRNRLKSLRPAPGQSGDQALLDAALTCATAWQWPVLPGVGRSGADSTRCACPDPDCVVPGAHPFDPGLLAATTDPRMVAWWWTNRPTAPVLLATGGPAPCAVSLPAAAAARAVVRLDAQGMRLGPIVATPTRWSLLVAPYSLERLGELLYAKDHVPSALRFHGEGGYLLLPPSPRPAAGRCGGSASPRMPGACGCRRSRPSWTHWSRRAAGPLAAAAGSRTDCARWAGEARAR